MISLHVMKMMHSEKSVRVRLAWETTQRCNKNFHFLWFQSGSDQYRSIHPLIAEGDKTKNTKWAYCTSTWLLLLLQYIAELNTVEAFKRPAVMGLKAFRCSNQKKCLWWKLTDRHWLQTGWNCGEQLQGSEDKEFSERNLSVPSDFTQLSNDRYCEIIVISFGIHFGIHFTSL